MIKIIRKRHFFRQHYNLILGLLWLSIGVAYYLVNGTGGFKILSVFNLLMGVAYLAIHFYQRDRNQEFIAWNEEQVILSKWQLKPVTYSRTQINRITITNSYFILHTNQKTPGETMELKGYSEKDIDLLKSRFSNQKISAG
ncbi:hypothetical protein JRG66_01905 [Salinimicrobium tongyeongense]|uniref:PH domain-containing protein n=1 Tax=Salinimicrobium tongyeongense TaxID=2809707 RepID=A0ABY6NSY5_9FLAO|nr:hypothetical protein [Salinimicrobium tongyeongense]UZH55668.1 hypothetical protein JRG66_01905 [Salinimicrobium tongyeongense]